MDDLYHYIIMSDGTITDFLRIKSKDIYAAGSDDNLLENTLWDKLYKTYPGDLKVISFYFPTETSVQQNYIDTIATRTVNPIYRELLQEEKEKLYDIHLRHMDKQFILQFFAKARTEYEENLYQIKATLNRMSLPIVDDFTAAQKLQILYKLNNKNMNL